MLNKCVILLVKFYQYFISPLIGPRCRFNPTCSNYILESYKKHTFIKATKLSLKRIIKCHPWGGSGNDPVPD
tara:strand:+ start:85 stop:300 length:216 start_codon:yes stop_codon:yes gene_type:complete